MSAANVSGAPLDEILAAAAPSLLDVHWDVHHNRTVLTVTDPRPLTHVAVDLLDLRGHAGVHPRHGVVDVVPFVPYLDSTMGDAMRARAAFIAWLGDELGVPAAAYGVGAPSLPVLRRDVLPRMTPHPTAGVTAVGARGPLVAYNVWVDCPLDDARRAATAVRSAAVRALAFAVGERVQVSMNLIEPVVVGPAQAFDAVAAMVPATGAELVGLVPAAVLRRVPEHRWVALDLGPDRTVESRLP